MVREKGTVIRVSRTVHAFYFGMLNVIFCCCVCLFCFFFFFFLKPYGRNLAMQHLKEVVSVSIADKLFTQIPSDGPHKTWL